MKRSFAITGALACAVTLLAGCSDPVEVATADSDVAALSDLPLFAKGGVQKGTILSDGEIFSTIGTPTSFKPGSGNFDELYTGGSFRDGIGAISESKPGDRDYNGGRWHVNVLKPGVDPDKYSDADSVEDLDPNDFMSTSTYFECPLLPVRGNGR